MTLGIPKASTCAHDKPTFGCDGCIGRDKQAILQDAISTTTAPPCDDCGGATVYSGSDVICMELYFACTVCSDGEATVEVKR